MQDDNEPTLSDNAITLTCSAATLAVLIVLGNLAPDVLLAIVR